ncbi:MAG: outer membrane beta-barrel protein [Marinoscillum sp.]
MKRLLIFVSVFSLVLLANESYAQKVNVGVNASASVPLGDNSDTFKAASGFDASLDYYFNDKVDFGVESGYKGFRYDADELDGEHRSVVPLLATLGLHNDIGDMLDLYGELGGGVFFMSTTLNDEQQNYGGLSPRLGVAVDLSEKWFLDTSLNYTHVFSDGADFNWVGLKFGILYTIN